MNLANIIDKAFPFLSSAALIPAILFSIFFALSGRKTARIFTVFLSLLSLAAALFLNIYAYITKGIFSDYLFSFNLIEAIQTGFILFAAINILIFIVIYNFAANNFIQTVILFLFTVLIFIFFIFANNFIMIFSSLALLCAAIFQLITVINSNNINSGKKSAAEYIIKNKILRYFLVTVFSLLFIFAGFSLIFGASDFKSFIQVLESEKIASPLLKTGLLLIFAGIIFYLFLFPFQAGYIRLAKKSEGVTNYIIWFFYFSAGIFLFLKLRNIFFYFAQNSTIYISLSVLIIASVTIFGGNLGAFKTSSMRRVMGFLYLANIGNFVLLAAIFAAGYLDGQRFTWLFISNLVTGALTYFPVFSIFYFIEKSTGSDSLQNITGLARQNRYIGSAIIILLLSFAGVPASAGFVSRIYTAQPLIKLISGGGNIPAQNASALDAAIIYAAAVIAVFSWILMAANIIRIIVILLQKPLVSQKPAFTKFYYIYITMFVLVVLWTGISGLMEMYGSGAILTFYPLLGLNF